MELFKRSKQSKKIINFVGIKKVTWSFSIAMCLIALCSLMFTGLNLSLEFTGGVQLEVRFNHPVSVEYINAKLEQAKYQSPKIQPYGSTRDFLIRLNISEKEQQVAVALSQEDNTVEIRKIEYIGSEVGEKLLEQGAIAVIIAILATMLYIALRFEYRLAISAAITLFHNAIIVLGCFSIFKLEFDLASLASILAVIGYTLNDTIVIFDRVRENFRKYHKESTTEIVNLAIHQTLSRTIMTSLLTLLVVLSLLFVGGKTLFGFALALTIGILIGTYASLGIAGSTACYLGLSRQDFLKR